MIFDILRQVFASVEPFFEFGVRDVPTDDNRSVERQTCGNGIFIQLFENFAHRLVEVYFNGVAFTGLAEFFGNEFAGVDFAPYQILLVMGAIFVLLAIPFLLFYMKQEIFAPMTALVSTMDRIGRGELSVRSSVDYRNAEFTQVNETFNRMIDQITQLKIDGYEKELEARRNEMTALKLQIRPHFVLNCLKSVYAMVQTGSREDAQQLILLLSRYLRYILSFTATTTPLHTEIEQCCNYAELSSVGQNDPVEVVCEIDPELSELPLPLVSLLTLVENSVKHGKMIGKTLSSGSISHTTSTGDRKSTRLNSSHVNRSRMPSSA